MDFTYIFIAAAVTIMMSFLLKASRKKPKIDEDGNRILRLPILYPIIGGIAVIFGLGLFIFLCIILPAEDIMFAFIVPLIALGLGVPLLLVSLVSKIKITSEGIEQTTMFGKQKIILWTDIKSITFGKVSLELKIKDENQKIKVHMHMVGFPDFISEIENKTGYSKKQMGLEGVM